MSSKFRIVSDGSCDIPEALAKENDIDIVHFLVSFNSSDYKKEGVDLALAELYQQMVSHPGVYPKTAAPSPEDFYAAFEKKAKEGQDILCICISTKLSSSVQSAEIARQMLDESYPDIRAVVVDSLCCTLMQSAFVLELCRMRDAGCSLDEALAAVDALRKSGRILFTVGNLDYLQHGGRIGRVTSIAGNLLDLKPLITLEDGEIHSSGIRRGRRKSLAGVVELLISYLKEQGCAPDDCNILIGYGYDPEEGSLLQEMTRKRLAEEFGPQSTLPAFQIGATIAVHAGPYSIGFGLVRRSDRLE
ncbi:MAG: DegV family protein [Candidatus Merdisoma sp.]